MKKRKAEMFVLYQLPTRSQMLETCEILSKGLHPSGGTGRDT